MILAKDEANASSFMHGTLRVDGPSVELAINHHHLETSPEVRMVEETRTMSVVVW